MNIKKNKRKWNELLNAVISDMTVESIKNKIKFVSFIKKDALNI